MTDTTPEIYKVKMDGEEWTIEVERDPNPLDSTIVIIRIRFFDSEGDLMFYVPTTLKYLVSNEAFQTFIRAYNRGYTTGKEVGFHSAQVAIQRALGIDPTKV